MIKQVLADELGSPVQDQDSSKAFGRLSDAPLEPDEKLHLVASLADQGREPAGYKHWQE
jgi:hypothetical protein